MDNIPSMSVGGLFSSGSQPRGLHNFIAEIRNCNSKEDERMRVDKELANIRAKFAASGLSSYQKKKYVWKMCYIYMLGYDVDFGHVEFISLLSSTKFQEKSVGYMAVSLLLKAGDPMMTLVVNSMRNDIIGNNLAGTTLALSAAANIGNSELAESLSLDIQRLLTTPNPSVAEAYARSLDSDGEATPELMSRRRYLLQKKSCLCLLQLYRTNNDCVDVPSMIPHIQEMLAERELGVVMSCMSLLLGFTAVHPEVFECVIPNVVSVLNRLVINRTCTNDYLYYRIPSPWLQIKCLRFLQYYQVPSDPEQLALLMDILNKICGKSDTTESVNKSNAEHSIIYEAISLVISYGVEVDSELRGLVQNMLGKFVASKDANIRYLALETLSRVARLEGPESVHSHMTIVTETLKDSDVSVRKVGLDLLFAMSDESNCREIVQELLINLTMAEADMKEEYCYKIAIIAEKFSEDKNWYIDIMIQVILAAGDYVAEEVWFRVIQVITNSPDVQEYACEKLLSAVKSRYAHETAICLAGYILGEFGVNICENEEMGGYEQFVALQQHFANVSTRTQALLLTTYVKLMNLYPALREIVNDVFSKHSTSQQLDIQQRSCEYSQLSAINSEVMETVLDNMPLFKEKESVLERKLKEEQEGKTRIIAKTERGAYVPPENSNNNGGNTGGFGCASSSAPMEKEKSVNLLGFDDDDFGGPGVDAGGARSYAPSLQAQVSKWYNACLLLHGPTAGQKGLLFEDSLLQVFVYPMYQSHQARLGIMLSNKGSSDFTNLAVAVDSTEALMMKMAAAPPSRMNVMEDVKLQVSGACMRPFTESPNMTVSWSCGGQNFSYILKLPILATQFFDGVALTKDIYMQRWKSLEGSGKWLMSCLFCLSCLSCCDLVFCIMYYVFCILNFSIFCSNIVYYR